MPSLKLPFLESGDSLENSAFAVTFPPPRKKETGRAEMSVSQELPGSWCGDLLTGSRRDRDARVSWAGDQSSAGFSSGGP